MSELIYECSEDYFIQSYYVTTNYIFLVESPLSNNFECRLKYFRKGTDVRIRTLDFTIAKSKIFSSLLIQGNGTTVIKSIQLVNVPDLRKGGLEICHFLVLNKSTSIQIYSLDDLIRSSGQSEDLNNEKFPIWNNSNPNEIITSVYSQGYKDNTIVVTYCTNLSNIVQFRYDIHKRQFQKIRLPSSLQIIKDQLLDSIINISGIQLGVNYPPSNNETLWSSLSSSELMAISSLDNTISTIINNSFEKIPMDSFISELSNSESNDNLHTQLVWADIAVLKKFTRFSKIYAIANITNIGIVLFKRSNDGLWDKIHIFKRMDKDEIIKDDSTSLIDCKMYLQQDRNTIVILSGSEDNKLYRWDFNYRDEILVDSTIYNNQPSEIKDGMDLSVSPIHSISANSNNEIFFLSNESKCINCIYL